MKLILSYRTQQSHDEVYIMQGTNIVCIKQNNVMVYIHVHIFLILLILYSTSPGPTASLKMLNKVNKLCLKSCRKEKKVP